MKYVPCAFLTIVFFVAPSCSWAWGCEGHQTIALIAEKYLTSRARAGERQILQANPIDSALPRNCKNAVLGAFADSSTWADDYRSRDPDTTAWHFIDIPRGASRNEVEKYCSSKGCVTRSLQQQIEILRDGSDPRKRADALRFVIHLTGDLHQPLHAITNNDRGGNCVPVAFFGQNPASGDAENDNYSPNLHSIWDFSILERMAGTRTVAEFASDLEKEFRGRAAFWEQSGIRLDAWAWESHEVAEEIAYGDLPVKIPIKVPRHVASCAGDGGVGARMLALHESVGTQYQAVAAAAIREQLFKAGIRLAMILNAIWK